METNKLIQIGIIITIIVILIFILKSLIKTVIIIAILGILFKVFFVGDSQTVSDVSNKLLTSENKTIVMQIYNSFTKKTSQNAIISPSKISDTVKNMTDSAATNTTKVYEGIGGMINENSATIDAVS